MDSQRKSTTSQDNQQLEKMYENLSNISKQLTLLHGFMENKYGSEFTAYCQLSGQSKIASLEGTYACPEGGPVNEDGEEYDKMPNLVSEESPSRTLGYVSVPLSLRQSSDAPRTASSSGLSQGPVTGSKLQDQSSIVVQIKCETNHDGKGQKGLPNTSPSNEDLMYPLHNFTDLLVENVQDEVTIHGSGSATTASTTPEFMEMELDPSQLLREGEPPTLHPMFHDNNQGNSHGIGSNSSFHSGHSSKRSASRHSSSLYKYEIMGVNNEPNSGNSHSRANNHRRTSVAGNESKHSSNKFDCIICGIQFEYAETLKSHMDSHTGCRNIRSSSDEQSGMEEKSDEPLLPRLMPRPVSIDVPITLNYPEEAPVYQEKKRSKKSRQTTSSSSSSGSSKAASEAKKRKRYSQSRPCSLVCPHCGLLIRDKSRLVEHIRGHTGERPFKCFACDKSYTRKDVLKTHMLKMHGHWEADGGPHTPQYPNHDELGHDSNNSIAQQKADEVITSF